VQACCLVLAHSTLITTTQLVFCIIQFIPMEAAGQLVDKRPPKQLPATAAQLVLTPTTAVIPTRRIAGAFATIMFLQLQSLARELTHWTSTVHLNHKG
jgi:hypothetical protein